MQKKSLWDNVRIECDLTRSGSKVRCAVTAVFDGADGASDEDRAQMEQAIRDWVAGKEAPCFKSRYGPLPHQDCVISVGRYSARLIEIEVAEG